MYHDALKSKGKYKAGHQDDIQLACLATLNTSSSIPGQVCQDHLPCFGVASPKTPGAPKGRTPEPPRGAPHQQWQELQVGKGTGHPASASPPGLGDGLSLTGRVAGYSHTWFPDGAAGAELWDAYVIALPPLATSPTLGTPDQDRTHGTNPDVQIFSKPNLGPCTQRLFRSTPSSTQSSGLKRTLPTPTPRKPRTAARFSHCAVSECPATGVRGAPGHGCLPLREATLRNSANPAPAPGPLAACSARRGASTVNSRVQPVTRAPQAPRTPCHMLCGNLAPSAGAYGFLHPACALTGADHRDVSLWYPQDSGLRHCFSLSPTTRI
ncbi:hypothetical protein ACRRTK_018472 [Alexandromys fortis]